MNELFKENGSTSSANLISEKPLLISIDRPDAMYYIVTSIRTYFLKVNGEQVTSTRVNSDAVALRGSQLIRLTIQRTLRARADVAQVQDEVTDWARATAQSSLPTGP
jgi:hypothetical protein